MALQRALIILLVSAIGLCLSANSAISHSHCEPGFVSESEGKEHNLVIVFVHGVFGDCEGTWTNPDNRRYWPKMAAKDHFFKGADVYVYYYPTGLDSAPSIRDLAGFMTATLWNDGVTTKYDQIAFVAHSLGGLVVRQFLRTAFEKGEEMPEVRFLYFLGTPHTAVQHRAAKFIAGTGNALFEDLTGRTTFVSDLMRDWQNTRQLSELRDFCAHELKKVQILGIAGLTLLGRKIVHEQSARFSCTADHMPVNENHVQMVKPEDDREMPHLYLRRAYLNTMKPAYASADE